jgi:Skp family chaperone for outer membrane proteins
MNRSRFLAVLAFLGVILVSPVLAQGPATQPKPQAAATQNATVSVPVSKVAVIYSEGFQDPKTGIARFYALVSKLNGEFQKIQNDLNQTAQKLKQLQDEITNLQSGRVPATPAQIQAKIDQLDQQKKDYQRKGEDAQASYQKRRQELFAPLQEDIGRALDVYARAHGINMIIDGSQVPLIYAAESIDITRSFISDYNSKNPATASTTTPK